MVETVLGVDVEIVVIVNIAVIWIVVWWNFFWFDKQIKNIWKIFKKQTELVESILEFDQKILMVSEAIDRKNQAILSSVPDSMKNLKDTARILDLAKKQQLQISIFRERIIATSAQLEEALDAVSYLGGQMKPDEAKRYLRLAGKKYGDKFGKVPPNVQVDIHDSHTDKKGDGFQ